MVEVIRGTPADEAGLRGGDQVLDVNGQQVQIGGDVVITIDEQAVSGFDDLKGYLQQAEPDQMVSLGVLRDGGEIVVEVTLGERPVSTP